MLEWFTRFIERWGNNDFLQKNMDTCFNNLFVLCIQETLLWQMDLQVGLPAAAFIAGINDSCPIWKV